MRFQEILECMVRSLIVPKVDTIVDLDFIGHHYRMTTHKEWFRGIVEPFPSLQSWILIMASALFNKLFQFHEELYRSFMNLNLMLECWNALTNQMNLWPKNQINPFLKKNHFFPKWLQWKTMKFYGNFWGKTNLI